MSKIPREAEATIAELKKTVAVAGGILYHLGLADYMGHCSARVPGTDLVVIKPRHSVSVHGMGTVDADRMIVIDLDGKPVEGRDGPPAEIFIHTEIYRVRPDVGGVVHTHQMMTTAFGVVGRPILPILATEAHDVKRPFPIYSDPDLVNSPERGRALAQALGDHSTVHIQNHGVVFTGPTVEEATLTSIHVERTALLNYFAGQLGTPNVITPAKIEEMARGNRVGYQVRFAYYRSLLETGALSARGVAGAPPIAQHLNLLK
jgi:ribulose-5-phosphate 4-epimerase/fuculose-1-phosphate aldolase